MNSLPKDIDYNKYNNLQGMSTKKFGPSAWDFLFISVIGRYPMKINYFDIEHLHIKNSFRNILRSLETILPCIFCRNWSY